MLYTDHDLVFRVIRDVLSDDVKEIIVDDANVYQRILEMSDSFPFPRGSIIDFFQKEIPIFAYYGIDNQIESALRRKVWLDCGGYLIFDHTEAFLSIDVNTGKYVGKTNFAETILKTNLEAAFEIARQLRLRNIGGIIIIDFIDMQDPKDKERVLAALKEALAKDRVKSRVIGFTELGLVEMTRKKSGKSLPELFETQCNACKGKGRVLAKSIDNS